MKKLLGILVLGLLLSGCSENQSETNRKKSTIKLSCEMNKVHLIKKYDGTTADIWYDEKFIKENLAELAKPSIIETNNWHQIKRKSRKTWNRCIRSWCCCLRNQRLNFLECFKGEKSRPSF